MPQRDPLISAILIVRNEETKIRRCLHSLRWADEVIVFDQSSDDATAAICREFTPHVFVVPNKGFCEPDRAAAAAKASHAWVFYIDADEVVTEELQREIRAICSGSPACSGYAVARKNIFLGTWIRGSGWYPGYVLRLFNKRRVRFPERIHEDITVDGPCGCLGNPLVHYTCENLAEYFAKINRYTTVSAQQSFQRGARITRGNILQKIVVLPLAYTMQKFFIKAGFRDGLHGLLIAFLTHLTVVVTQCKIAEMQTYNGKKS
jgi:glycosyltransferase involved in cell wall biosynthesis